MTRDAQPAFYRYHQVFCPPGEPNAAKIVRRGFIARIRLHRFSEGVVLPHERTLSGPKVDRLSSSGRREPICHRSLVRTTIPNAKPMLRLLRSNRQNLRCSARLRTESSTICGVLLTRMRLLKCSACARPSHLHCRRTPSL